MWTKFKLLFVRLFYRVGIWWWVWWSRLYRVMRHRRYSTVKLDRDVHPDFAVGAMQPITWTKDGLKELWNACGSPKWVQYVINSIRADEGQPEGALDCDDYAVWAANVVIRAYKPRILSLAWAKNGSIGGHAVCLIEKPQIGSWMPKYYHIGNWGKRGPFNSIRSLCQDMMIEAGADTVVGWTIFDKDMDVLAWGRDLPLLMEPGI